MVQLKINKVIDLRRDVVFKIFFSKEKNKEILVSFLNDVINSSNKIVDLKILNPLLSSEIVNEKRVELDLLVQLSDQTFVNIEVQIQKTFHFRKRIFYYASQLMKRQLKKGQGYQNVMPIIIISILDYNEFQENTLGPHLKFQMYEINKKISYDDVLTLHFIELAKYKWSDDFNLNKWIKLFLIHELKEDIIEEFKGDLIMEKAVNSLVEISEEEREELVQVLRERDEIDRMTANYELYENGIKAGYKQGKIETIAELVFSMHHDHFSIDKIAKILKITEDEIRKILES